MRTEKLSLSIPDIIAALEGGSGPDRQLDAEIMFSLFAKPVQANPRMYLWPEDNPSWSFGIAFPDKDEAWIKATRAKSGEETLVVHRGGVPILMNSLRVLQVTRFIDAATQLLRHVVQDDRDNFGRVMIAGASRWEGSGAGIDDLPRFITAAAVFEWRFGDDNPEND